MTDTCDRNKLMEPFSIPDSPDNSVSNVSVVRIGYELCKAHELLIAEKTEGAYYLNSALQRIEILLPHVISAARKAGHIAYKTDFGEALDLLYTAKHGIDHWVSSGVGTRGYALFYASAWKIKNAHHKLAVIMSGDPAGMNASLNAQGIKEPGFNYGYGYRHVTLRDLAREGAGGDR